MWIYYQFCTVFEGKTKEKDKLVNGNELSMSCDSFAHDKDQPRS